MAKSSANHENVEPWKQYLIENESAHQLGRARVDERDGLLYEWNEEKQGWFPKVTDDFIANYQATYGFGEDLKPTQVVQASGDDLLSSVIKRKMTKKESKTKEKEQKGVKKDPEWFQVDQDKNTHVYVSGLPFDTTEEEFMDMMTKFGIIAEDPETGNLKVKMYRDSESNFKGDALCCYLKVESVKLALDILNDSELRGCKIRVEKAVFKLKGAYDPKKKVKKQKLKKKGKSQDKLLDWVDRAEYKKAANMRAAVIHHLFDPKEFADDPGAIMDYKKELKEECERFGEVKKVFVFDRNPEGVCSVLFRTEEAAQQCVEAMDGRMCAGRTLISHIWDGFEKYEIKETEEEKEERIRKWEEYINKGCDDDQEHE